MKLDNFNDIPQIINENIEGLFYLIPGMLMRRMAGKCGKIVWVSDGCSAITGYSANELLSASHLNYYDLIYDEDREKVLKPLSYRIENEEQNKNTIEYRIKTKNGDTKWVKEVFRTQDVDGASQELIESYITDITRNPTALQNQSEDHFFKKSIENSLLVIEIGLDGRILQVNDLFCTFAKFTKEQIVGKSIKILRSGFHSADFYSEIIGSVSKGITWRGEIKNRASDNTFFWTAGVVTPVFDENNQIRRYISISNIVDDKKRAEEKNILSLREISNAEKINQSILRGDTITEIAQLLLKALDEITGIRCSNLYLYDEQSNSLVLTATNQNTTRLVNYKARSVLSLSANSAEMGMVGEIMQQKKNVFFNQKEDIARIASELMQENCMETCRNELHKVITAGVLPIFARNRFLGFVSFFSDNDLNIGLKQTIVRFSHHAAIVITKKRNDERMEEMKSRLKFINDYTPDLLITVDKNYAITYMNRQHPSLSANEVTGRCILDFVPVGSQRKYKECIDKAFQGVQTEFELSGYVNDFYLAWYSVRMTGIEKNGAIVSVLIISTNITDRKLAEQKTRSSEERFRSLFDRNPAGVYRASMDNVILECNDAFAGLLGFSQASDIVGKPAAELYTSQYYTDFSDTPKSQNRRITGRETRFCLKDGKEVYAIENVSLVFDENGDPSCIEGTIMDVTGRKEAEKALQKAQERYKLLLENMHEGFVADDVHGNVIYANPRFCEIFGFDERQMNNRVMEDSIAPSYRMLLREQHNRRINGERVPDSYEFLGIKADGTMIWVEAHVNVVIENDVIVGTQALMRDITEKKLKETQFKELAELHRKIIDSSDELFYVVEPQMGSEFHNPIKFISGKLKEFTGYEPDDIIGGKNIWFNTLHPDDKSNVEKCAAELEEKRQPLSCIYRLKNLATNEYIWLYDHIKPILDENEKIIELYGSIKNITELKNREQELERTAKDLNNRYNELMQFNYIVSHNLRSPVANILGIMSVLGLPDTSEEEQQTCLEFINTAVQKLDNVIKDLNSILETRSNLSVKREIVNIEALVGQVIETLQKDLTDAGVEINCQFDKNATEISTIKSYAESILYNLVNNGIKYKSAERRPEISITTRLEGGDIVIAVRDNGCGIDLKRFGKQVFGLYKRFATNIEGKGLGLYMTKTQVETLGGTISVESEPNEGTVFFVKLPVNDCL